MKGKRSKEARLLHAIAQAAPSVPTTECGTHMGTAFCWQEASLPL